ncbi:hypothetical protein V6N11_059949 [Hibiscus sabdariffa]|uniref:Uncharacterized protein n=1 Tax=Hibiscus sabdariffa TaxID=183260 RepID=A0ABR2NYR4_9ROSI
MLHLSCFHVTLCSWFQFCRIRNSIYSSCPTRNSSTSPTAFAGNAWQQGSKDESEFEEVDDWIDGSDLHAAQFMNQQDLQNPNQHDHIPAQIVYQGEDFLCTKLYNKEAGCC